MTDPSTLTLSLRIPARAEYLVLGRLVLTAISRSRPIDAETLGDLRLALTEACGNAIRHAYALAPGDVEMRFELGDDYIAVEVLDDGPGFDPASRAGAARSEVDSGGMGLALIEAVSDASEIGRRGDGTGSRVRFTKLLA